MTDLENREAFEREIIALCGFNPNTALERSEVTGDYKSDVIYFSWLMWNASAQREGFKLVPNSFIADIHDMALDGKYLRETDQTQDKFEEIQEYCKEVMINAV